MYHSWTHLIAYCESDQMSTDWVGGTICSARKIAVSSARWFVWTSPASRSEMFLLVPR